MKNASAKNRQCQRLEGKSKANSKAEQSSVLSEATVNSVSLSKDEKALAKRDEDKRRDVELKQIESNAERFVRNWNKATEIGNQIHTLRRTFTDLFGESRPLLENVVYGFRHLRKDESIMGCATLEEWSPKHCGVTARWLRKLLNPTEAKVFITDGTSEVIETKIISIADGDGALWSGEKRTAETSGRARCGLATSPGALRTKRSQTTGSSQPSLDQQAGSTHMKSSRNSVSTGLKVVDTRRDRAEATSEDGQGKLRISIRETARSPHRLRA